MRSLMTFAGTICLPRIGLGARSAGSISCGVVPSSPENRRLSNGTNHVSGGGSVPSDRRRSAGFFQAAGGLEP